MSLHRALAACWLACWLGAGCLPQQGSDQAQAWRRLAAEVPFEVPGLGAQVWLAEDLLPNARFAVVRLPAASALSVHSTLPLGGPALSVADWAAKLGPPGVVFNAGFYARGGSHVGWLKAHGTWLTAAPRADWYGLLFSGANTPGLPPCQLVDALDYPEGLADPGIAALAASYDHVVQSMVLFGDDRRLRTKASARRASRTALGIDWAGRLLVLVSEGAVTLPELAAALSRPSLGIVRAINLDGGLESQLAIGSPAGGHTLLGRHGSRAEVPQALFQRLPARGLPSVLRAPSQADATH